MFACFVFAVTGWNAIDIFGKTSVLKVKDTWNSAGFFANMRGDEVHCRVGVTAH